MTRKDWLLDAEAQLTMAGIDSARLNSELLLTHALNISRTALHAHPEAAIPAAHESVLAAMLSLRIIRVPVAYIVGHREFYGRLFKVTPSVLIPRPETEDIVGLIAELPEPPRMIFDIGTGSGALAVTLALEYPSARVVASDVSRRALAVAERNATAYGTAVDFIVSDLLADFPVITIESPTVMVANLPYVAPDDERSAETGFEPSAALFAPDGGLALISRLIVQASGFLETGAYLLLESNPAQQPAIAALAHENGFALERTRRLVTVLRRTENP